MILRLLKKLLSLLFGFLNLNYLQRFKFLYFFRNIILGFLGYLPFTSLKTLCSIAGAYKFKDFPEIYLSLDNYIERKKVKKLAEIGVGSHNLNFGGGKSLMAFANYYRDAKVFGLDINDKSYLDRKNIKTIICDQGNKNQLKSFAKKFGNFDIIIDDGSHFVNHQILSFEVLFKYLNDGGVYIIEDCAGSYLKAYNGDPNLSPKKNLISYFQQKVHSTNSSYLQKKFERNVLDISLITFAREAIAIKKKVSKNKFKYQKKAFLNLNKLEKRKDKFGSLNLKKDQ